MKELAASKWTGVKLQARTNPREWKWSNGWHQSRMLSYVLAEKADRSSVTGKEHLWEAAGSHDQRGQGLGVIRPMHEHREPVWPYKLQGKELTAVREQLTDC